MLDSATACAIAICWGLPALAFIGGADALRAVRSLALSCLLATSTAYGLCSLFNGTFSTWLTVIALMYTVGLIVAHVLGILAVKYYSGQEFTSAAADDSYRMKLSPARTTSIEDTRYYEYYNGHQVRDLRYAHGKLHESGCKSFIFLCGDSSFDNKHWFFRKGKQSTSNATAAAHRIAEDEMRDDAITAPATNGYERVLVSASARRGRPGPRMTKDVCYWLNHHAPGDGDVCTLMASVEASTAADRCEHKLLKQDEFIRDTLTRQDYILMSVGGNDIAMAPTIATLVNIGLLTFSPYWLIWLRLAPGYTHLVHWMGAMVVEYVRQLTRKATPKKVVCCMIYYPDETPTGGWVDTHGLLTLLFYRRRPGIDSSLAANGEVAFGPAGRLLGLIGLLAFPGMLQSVIRALYYGLAGQLRRARQAGGPLEGLDVVAFPLFEVLDGQHTADYNQRVEPSVQGGEKMATALLAELRLANASSASSGKVTSAPLTPGEAGAPPRSTPTSKRRPSRSPRRRAA